MSKFRSKGEVDDDGRAFSPNCSAHGCPLRGTVDYGNSGRHFCAAHSNTSPSEWGRITSAIRDHQWLTGLIGDLMRMAQSGKDWASFATEFWQGEDAFMVPNDDERRNPAAYLSRMFGELQWRVGRRKHRPGPWSDPNKTKARPQDPVTAFLHRELEPTE